MNFKNKIMTFFAGRYGVDELQLTLIGISLVLGFANMWISNTAVNIILPLLSLVLDACFFVRLLSRDFAKRRLENAAFVGFWSRRKLNFQQRKTHKFYGCPKCKATLRVPKGKGKITITCNRCGTQFTKKT